MKLMVFLGIGSLAIASVASAQVSAPSSTISAEQKGELDNWSLRYSNYTNGQTFTKTSSEEKVSEINHYVDLTRKFGKWSAGPVARFDTVWTREEGQKDLTADHYLKVTTPAFVETPAGTTVRGQLRAFAPTSQASKDKGQQFAAEPRVILETKATDKIDVTALLLPKIYSYETQEEGQTTGKIGSYIQAVYNVSPKVTLDFGVSPSWTYTRGEGQGEFNDLPIYPGATVNFTENFSVSPYLEILAAKPKRETTLAGAFVSYKVF